MPGEDLVRWAVDAALPGGTVVTVDTLREPSGPWRLRLSRDGDLLDVVLKTAPAYRHPEFACEIAALRFAEEHRLPAPRLIATDLAGSFGAIGFVATAMTGNSAIPLVPTAERLRSAGAAAAMVHWVPLRPRDDLPLRARQMPWIDFSEERRTGRSPTTDLLDEVDARLAAAQQPAGETVFVHGGPLAGQPLVRR